jgi:glucose-1-phosphate cytidylyltransferase
MQTVILCGGKGTRMGQDLEGLPKALIPIGDKPIIWHIMKYYSCFGFNDFILCLGYKGSDIISYFKNKKEFKIRFLDTGIETNTGGRIKIAERLIKEEVFLATYGDGLSDVKIKSLLKFHKEHKKTATLTAVRPRSTFGIAGIDSKTSVITHFQEKPLLDHWINGGFFVFNRSIFSYLKPGDVLESDTFKRLVRNRELLAYKHKGFWECMDTYKDNLRLNELWLANKAPWSLGKGR